MCKFLFFLTGSIFFALSAVAAPSASDVLKLLDSARGNAKQGVEIQLAVTTIIMGGEQETKRYRLLDNGLDSTIVEFLDPSERGNKILSSPSEMWFFAARARRAIKVPSVQRLFGDASIGDVAKLAFGRDYRTEGDTPHVEVASDERRLRIGLTARRESATYSRIAIRVRERDLVPVYAEYFLASGKHGKTAEFVNAKVVGGRLVNDEWLLSEPSNPNRKTRIKVESVEEKDFPDSWFTQRYLELSR